MQIYIHRDGQQFGPFSIEQARDYLEAGNLVPDDLAWYDESVDWVPLGEVPGMAGPPAPAPVRSSMPDWVPPRRERTVPANVGLPGQTVPTPTGSKTFSSPVLPGQSPIGPVPAISGLAPPNVPQPVQRILPPRPGDPFLRAQRASAVRNIGMGALFFFGGGAITVFSYEEATQSAGGGTYFLACGAILYGGFRLVAGVIQYFRG